MSIRLAVRLLSLLLGVRAILLAQPMQQLTMWQTPPPQVASASAVYTGTVSGGSQIFYWVVVRYPRGAALPSAPAVASNTPGSANLTASRLVTVSWSSMPGASSYDVLRSNTATYPAQTSCTCAVALATTATSVTDTGGALSAYPPSTLGSASTALFNLQINNRDEALPYLTTDLSPGLMGTRLPLLNTGYTAGQFAQVGADGNLTGVNLTISSTGAFASAPAACTNGDLYFPNDSVYVMRCQSNAWVPWGPVYPLVALNNAQFSWVNQGTATITT